jgi:hypothetical protein
MLNVAYAECHYAECRQSEFITPNVVKLNANFLNVVAPNVSHIIDEMIEQNNIIINLLLAPV